MSATLPAPHGTGRYRISMVCLGNICRSPMAQVVFDQRIAVAGLSDLLEVDSAGTADWHVGKDMDPRSRATLVGGGYDPAVHAARQYGPDWQHSHDLVLVMDRSNLADVGGSTERLRLFADFDPLAPGGEVPDPYYGGDEGFKEVLAMLERTCDALLAAWLSGPGNVSSR